MTRVLRTARSTARSGLVRALAFVLLATSHAGLAAAQTVPSTFKDMQILVGPGDRVTVINAAGGEINGKISELDAARLTIESASGPRSFTQDDVLVVRQRRADPISNGVLIGAAVGAGLGLVAELSCGFGDEYCPHPGWVTLGTTLWGSGIGALADALHWTPTDIFRHGPGTIGSWSVAPVVGRGAAGARVALRW
jgi:hypothetical protein